LGTSFNLGANSQLWRHQLPSPRHTWIEELVSWLGGVGLFVSVELDHTSYKQLWLEIQVPH